MGSTHLPIVGFNASTTPSLSTIRPVNSAGAAFQPSAPSRTSKKKSRRVQSLRDGGDGGVSDPNQSIRQGNLKTISFLQTTLCCHPQTCVDTFID